MNRVRVRWWCHSLPCAQLTPCVCVSSPLPTFPRSILPVRYLAHLARSNTIAGSRKNINEHYDIGNDLFALFLDDTMTYSSAIFPGYAGGRGPETVPGLPAGERNEMAACADPAVGGALLRAATNAKLDEIIAKAKLTKGESHGLTDSYVYIRSLLCSFMLCFVCSFSVWLFLFSLCSSPHSSPTKDDHVVEIGCGWGSFAIRAAQTTGCKVTGITISTEQLDIAKQRVAAAGLSERVNLVLCDYRKLKTDADLFPAGGFDKLVSIEMLEAVGHENLQEYFDVCSQLVRPSGLCVIQVITIPDERYEAYCKSSDFIKRHIFPGGHLPAKSSVESFITGLPLDLVHVHDIGPQYAPTLRMWRLRFMAKKEEILALGYSDVFYRKWIFYFAYCEAAFANRCVCAPVFPSSCFSSCFLLSWFAVAVVSPSLPSFLRALSSHTLALSPPQVPPKLPLHIRPHRDLAGQRRRAGGAQPRPGCYGALRKRPARKWGVPPKRDQINRLRGQNFHARAPLHPSRARRRVAQQGTQLLAVAPHSSLQRAAQREAMQKCTRVLISLRDSLMFGRVPGTRYPPEH